MVHPVGIAIGIIALVGIVKLIHVVSYNINKPHSETRNSTSGHQITPQNRPDASTPKPKQDGSKDKTVQLQSNVTYNVEKVVGKGKEGVIYEGKFGKSTKAAIKIFTDVDESKKACLRKRMVGVNESLLNITNPNIVKFFLFGESGNSFYMCMELCECNLRSFISKRPQEVPKDGFKQMLNGLNGLHDNKFIHRDIKPSNVLVKTEKANRFILKLSDFSLAKETTDNMSAFSGLYIGTKGWVPPEISQRKEPNEVKVSADIFTCGMLGFYICTGGKMLYNSQIDIDHDIADYSHLVDPTAEDLVRAMTCRDERERPDAKMCLKHPFHWDSCKTLGYYKVVSDTMIGEQRQGMTNMSNALDQHFNQVFQQDWEIILTPHVQNELFTRRTTFTR